MPHFPPQNIALWFRARLVSTMNAKEINRLLEFYRHSLLEDSAKFWFNSGRGNEHGGYLHCLDRDGAVLDTDKSVWAQGRMAWMLATLHNTVERRADWFEWSKIGLDFLEEHCSDTDGRMFFHVTREGRPVRKRRYAFSEAFATIAHAAYAKATGDARSAARAHELFDVFVDWNFTPGRIPPKLTDTRPAIGMGPRMITIVTAQELRVNLGADAKLDGWIGIDHALNRAVRDSGMGIVDHGLAPPYDSGVGSDFAQLQNAPIENRSLCDPLLPWCKRNIYHKTFNPGYF